MVSPLQVDVSVYKGNIKVDLDYLLFGTDEFDAAYLVRFAKDGEKAGADVEKALIRLPFDVGIRSARGAFSTKGGLHYHKTIYVDLSVERGDLTGTVGDEFLAAFGKVVKSMGGELTNKGRRVGRVSSLVGRWLRRVGAC